MLHWANRFSICCFMNSHLYEDKYHSFDCLLAVDAIQIFSPEKNIFLQLDNFYNNCDDWIFGHLNYDLKNEIENLHAVKTNKIDFPDIFLFQPAVVIAINKNAIEISCFDDKAAGIFKSIKQVKLNNDAFSKLNKKINSAITKDEYINTIEELKKHLLRGDCYEINFCQEFFIGDANINPLEIYNCLHKISPSPFSCYYKLNDKYLLCASPERFLAKHGQTIFSQPIKGTAARNDNDVLDALQRDNLYNSAKEKSENVMIVDLVRNDLSKICKKGSVVANELFGIYSFPQVHQMISTVSGILKNDISFSDIIKATFPMGSMTGAPKHRVMQLIDQYEKTNRGLFSGSVGYITPEKNFDFNVIIRSIFYNQTNKYLNYFAGSAITIYADADSEYEECRLKAAAIENILT
jgi:para-aminobenzoate synthetase component 1